VKPGELDKLATTLTLLNDGRLVGADSAVDSHDGERLTAALTAATATGATALSLLGGAGPPGIAAAVGAALAAGVVAWSAGGADGAVEGAGKPGLVDCPAGRGALRSWPRPTAHF
jgi:hypothetical protein